MFFPNKPDEDLNWPVEILYSLAFFTLFRIRLCRSLFDFDSMKVIFNVNSERANGKRKCCCKKKFDELGRVKGGGSGGGSGAW